MVRWDNGRSGQIVQQVVKEESVSGKGYVMNLFMEANLVLEIQNKLRSVTLMNVHVSSVCVCVCLFVSTYKYWACSGPIFAVSIACSLC